MPEKIINAKYPDRNAKEDWHSVIGYDGWYEVSNLGRNRNVLTRKGTYAGRILSPVLHLGYPAVRLSKHGVTKTLKVHRIVAAAFIGPCPDGLEVNHKDGVKTNNLPSNLEYITETQNHEHAVIMGLTASGDRNASRLYPERVARGERNGLSKMTDRKVIVLRRLASMGWILSMLSEKYGICTRSAHMIRSRKTWKHIP